MRPARAQVGARDRAIQAVRELGLVGRRRAAGQRGPGVGQAGGGLVGERADGGVDLCVLDGRRGRERGARVFVGLAAEAEAAQRIGPQAPQPGRPGNSGGERAAVHVGALDGADDAGQPCGVGERRDQLLAVAPAHTLGSPVADGGPEGPSGGVDVGREPRERRCAAAHPFLDRLP